MITYQWRGDFASAELEAPHAGGFGRAPGEYDWKAQVEAQSLGWVCARHDGELAGQFSDRRVAYDASELAFCVADMSVMLTGRPGGSADERFRTGGSSYADCWPLWW